jgi:hypothetical protein
MHHRWHGRTKLRSRPKRAHPKIYRGESIQTRKGVSKITNLKLEIYKCTVSVKYVFLRNAAHMLREERMMTRYRSSMVQRYGRFKLLALM